MTTNPTQLKTVAILGAGTMGQGIAQVCASAGHRTLLYDADPSQAQKAKQKIFKSLSDAEAKGKLTAHRREEILSLIQPASEIAEVNAGIFIEAIVESLEAKQKLFLQIESTNGGKAILATNTSSLPVSRIASALRYPDRFLGIHFFNPAPLMRLVEVVGGGETDTAVIEDAMTFVTGLGKDPVRCRDTPGFIVNRVARHFYLESLAALGQHAASIETIDALLRSAGFKMGPFELMDLIGIDINYAVSKSVYEAFELSPRFRPHPIQEEKVKAGTLGRKSGEGFYRY